MFCLKLQGGWCTSVPCGITITFLYMCLYVSLKKSISCRKGIVKCSGFQLTEAVLFAWFRCGFVKSTQYNKYNNFIVNIVLLTIILSLGYTGLLIYPFISCSYQGIVVFWWRKRLTSEKGCYVWWHEVGCCHLAIWTSLLLFHTFKVACIQSHCRVDRFPIVKKFFLYND